MPITQYDAVDGDRVAIVRDRVQSFRLEGAWPQTLLSTLCIGSAGVVLLIEGYGPHLPHVGTSPAVVDSRSTHRTIPALSPAHTDPSPEQSSLHEVLALSAADQAREVLAALSLNKSQLAEVLQVSRPTLYDWLDGKEPNASNEQRLTALLRLLAKEGVTSCSPLNARFVRQKLHENGSSLLELLQAQALDEGQIASLLREAKALGERAESRRSEREERLRALGFEEPSDEEKREQLARNVAMLDWPKD